MDLTQIQRVPEDLAWRVEMPGEQPGEEGVFRDADFGGPLPALLQALDWRSDRTGVRKDWGWVEEGLERVDRGGTHGWWASVNLGTHLDADLFEDAEHGGTREALLAALAWRRRIGRGGGGGGGAGAGGGSAGGRVRGGRGQRGPKEKRGAPPQSAAPRRSRKRSRRPKSRPPQ